MTPAAAIIYSQRPVNPRSHSCHNPARRIRQMKTLLHKIRDGATATRSNPQRQYPPSSQSTTTDDDSNLGHSSSSSSSHTSLSSAQHSTTQKANAAGRRSRSHTTQPAKLLRQQQQKHHDLQQNPLPVMPHAAQQTRNAEVQYPSQSQSQSSPSLAVPQHPHHQHHHQHDARGQPAVPKSPRKFTNGFSRSPAPTSVEQTAQRGPSSNSPWHSDGATRTPDGARLAPAQPVQESHSGNTIRPSRSFRENPLGSSFAMIKDRFANSSVGPSSTTPSGRTHEHNSPFPSLSASSTAGTNSHLFSDYSHTPASSGFSTSTMPSAVEQNPASFQYAQKRNGSLTVNGDGNSSGGSAASLARTPRLSVEDSAVRKYRQLLHAESQQQEQQQQQSQAQYALPSPSPSPSLSMRPASRSRTRNMLSRLKRPLTAGSTRESDEAPFSFGAKKSSGFGFSKKAAKAESEAATAQSGYKIHSTAAPTSGESTVDDSLVSGGVTVSPGMHSSLDFDRTIMNYARRMQRRPSTADVTSPQSSFSMSTAQTAAPTSMSSSSQQAFAQHHHHHQADPRTSVDSTTANLPSLIAELINDHHPALVQPTSPISPTIPSSYAAASNNADASLSVSAKVAKIIDWAEQVAAKERRPSAATTSSSSAGGSGLAHASGGNVGAGSSGSGGGSRSLGSRGLGIYSSALLRSIDYLEMMVETPLNRGGEQIADHPSVAAAFEHAKHLCVPIATPTNPVASELPSDMFHTGLSPALLHGYVSGDGMMTTGTGGGAAANNNLSSALSLPLTPTSLNPRSPKENNGRMRLDHNSLANAVTPLSPPPLLNNKEDSSSSQQLEGGVSAHHLTAVAHAAAAGLSGLGGISTSSPPQQQQQQQPSPSELLASLVASPPAEPRKPIDSVSPFEQQTSAKEAGLSLTPAPRRRRRPTTAPETGAGSGGPPVFGNSFGAGAGGGGGARAGMLSAMADRSPRAVELPPLALNSSPYLSIHGGGYAGVTTNDVESMSTAGNSPRRNSQNRRSLLHHSPSRSYSGQYGVNAASHSGTDTLTNGGGFGPGVVVVAGGRDTPSSSEAFEMLRSASPYEPGAAWDARVPFSPNGGMGGGGAADPMSMSMTPVSSRPSTANSVATVTGLNGTGGGGSLSSSLSPGSGVRATTLSNGMGAAAASPPSVAPSPQLQSQQQQEVFTPEAFRAGPRPAASRPSTAGGVPASSSSFSASSSSLSSSKTTTTAPYLRGSDANLSQRSFTAASGSTAGSGLGIRIGAGGGSEDTKVSGGGGSGGYAGLSPASLRSKLSRNSVRDAEAQDQLLQQYGYQYQPSRKASLATGVA
ncbi:hypothetical protein V8E36_003767 [Tilletia maclaganii]